MSSSAGFVIDFKMGGLPVYKKTLKPKPYGGGNIVHMSDVAFAWPGHRGSPLSIKDFALESGSKTLLVGPSGAGKSTLLSLLCGVIVPSRGHINILGTDIMQLSQSARDQFRAEHIGVIFQMFNLLPYGSLIDNVILPLSFARERRSRVSARSAPEIEACLLYTSDAADD